MEVHHVIILDETDKKSNVPAYDDFNNICRVCLATIKDLSSNGKNIHEEDNKMNIRSLLEVYTYVKVPEYKDMLPQNICKNCLEFLMEIHTFRSRCRVNDDLLHKIHDKHFNIENRNPIIEDDFEDSTEKETLMVIDKINNERMGIFKCKDCVEVFSNHAELMKHRKTQNHSRKPASACQHCGKMFTSTSLIQHLRTHTKERPFVCNICHADFTVKNNLKRHLKIHSNERAYTCEICGKSFIRQESLAFHLKKHEEEKDKDDDSRQSSTTFEENSQSSIFEENNDQVTSENVHKCPDCDKVCKSEEQLKMHTRYHKLKFLCTECGKVFATKANLVTHIRVHTGEKPYICPECSRGFSQSSSLRIHMSVHDGSKAYACEFCNRRFSVRGNLTAHKRLHTGATPHRCDICNKGYCTSSTLRKHLRAHAKKEARIEQSFLKSALAKQRREFKITGSIKSLNQSNITKEEPIDEDLSEEDEENIMEREMIEINTKHEEIETTEEEIYIVRGGEEEIIIEEYPGEDVYYEDDNVTYVDEVVHDEVEMVEDTTEESNGDITTEENVIMIGPDKYNVEIVHS